MRGSGDPAPGVYLAGALDLVDPALALGWRAEADRRLEELGLAAVDPARVPVPAGMDPQALHRRNQALLASCAAVLAEHAFSVPHWGTTVEVEWAAVRGMPVVVWTGELGVPLYLRRLEPRVVIEPDLGRAVMWAAAMARARAAGRGDARGWRAGTEGARAGLGWRRR